MMKMMLEMEYMEEILEWLVMMMENMESMKKLDCDLLDIDMKH